jgi:hypothetical protein
MRAKDPGVQGIYSASWDCLRWRGIGNWLRERDSNAAFLERHRLQQHAITLDQGQVRRDNDFGIAE